MTYEPYGGLRLPNFERLSKESVRFTRAYASVALCGPSRLSFLTARSPANLNYYLNFDSAAQERQRLQGSMSLPRWLRKKKLNTVGISKIFHEPLTSKREFGRRNYKDYPVHLDRRCTRGSLLFCKVKAISQTTDYRAVRKAIEYLDDFSRKPEERFAILLGIRRPHVNFRVPKYLVQQIDRKDLELPDLSSPENKPWQATYPIPEGLDKAKDVRWAGHESGSPIGENPALYIKRRYMACVAMVDVLLGLVLDKLDETGFASNTLLVVTADHGYLLGESGQWGKGTNNENALKVPLYIRDPDAEVAPGTRVDELVELVHLFPTVAELIGEPLSESAVLRYKMDGWSMASLVRPQSIRPRNMGQVYRGGQLTTVVGHRWSYPESTSFSVWPVCVQSADSNQPVVCPDVFQTKLKFNYLGYSVRTPAYRYTEWRPWVTGGTEADWSPQGDLGTVVELYEHGARKEDKYERNNLSESRGSRTTLQLLSRMVRARFAPCREDLDRDACEYRGSHCKFTVENGMGRCHLLNDCNFHTKEPCQASRFCAWVSNQCKPT